MHCIFNRNCIENYIGDIFLDKCNIFFISVMDVPLGVPLGPLM